MAFCDFEAAFKLSNCLEREDFLKKLHTFFLDGKVTPNGICLRKTTEGRVDAPTLVWVDCRPDFPDRAVAIGKPQRACAPYMKPDGGMALWIDDKPSPPQIIWAKLRVMEEEIVAAFSQADDAPPSEDVVLEMIRTIVKDRGGFIGQKDGAAIVLAKYPSFNATRARELVKSVTGNTKRGPRGPRK